MEKSNLIKLLKALSPKEFKEFGEYVYSPFFNKNESIRKLYDYLKKYYPEFETEKVKKERIHDKIFTGVIYNDDFMRMLIFNMTKLAEDYLAYLRMTTSNWEMNRMLAYELNERSLDKPLEKVIKKSLAELDKTKQKNSSWYFHKYTIQYENVDFLRRKYLSKFEKFLKEAPLDNMHEEFTAYYLITVLKMQVFILNTKVIYNIDKDVASFEKVIETLDNKYLERTPLIQIYYNLMMLLYTNEEEYFYKTKKDILDYEAQITDEDMLEILINLQNFCSRRIRKGEIQFTREVFDLYKLEIDKNLYDHYGYLHDILYKNIIEIGMQIGENVWVKKFLEKHKKHLKPDIQEDAYLYGKAFVEFSEENYEKALEHLSMIRLYDVLSKIEVKELSAKIYFEMKLEDMLFSLTDTFRHLLTNSKVLTEDRKLAYANFIKYIKRLYKISLHPATGDIAEIRQMIKKEERLENRLWLNKKVEELDKRSRR
ncbi:MAG TPA: hypothetical protein VK004_06345 [Ignavibacteria bacterium]|nr:hypothetical protein [Ignavibacteria bacterium]